MSVARDVIARLWLLGTARCFASDTPDGSSLRPDADPQQPAVAGGERGGASGAAASDGRSHEPDELEIVVEPLIPDPSGKPRQQRSPTARQVLRAASLLLAVALLLVGANALFPILRRPGPVPTPTPRTPVPTMGPAGWILAGPAWAQTIVFAPSAPAIAYVCGVPGLPQPNQAGSVAFAMSFDTGRSWRQVSTPAIAVSCYLTVDPADPLDVVLVADPCPSCTPLAPLAMYRSGDGGQSWHAWSLPPRPSDGRRDFEAYNWAWVGSTLFLAPYVAGESSNRRLAASVAGQPFVWLSTNGLFAGAPSSASINQLIGAHDTLYAGLDFGNSCTGSCFEWKKTSTGGALWTEFAPRANGQSVDLQATDVEGKTLYGETASGSPQLVFTYWRSADGGVTWSALAPPPACLTALSLTAVPDGTIYGHLWLNPAVTPSSTCAVEGIYKLVPGAASWRFVAPEPGGGGWEAVAWDEQGHATALWSRAYQQEAPDLLRQGIEYHQP
jgi:hypothetical protein